MLAAPQDLDGVALAIMTKLDSGAIAWDVLGLATLPRDLPGTAALEEAAATRGFKVHTVASHDNPGIGLDDTWEAYYGRRTRRLKKGNNLVRNRLERDGKAVDIRCIDSATCAELEPLLETVIQLSARSWKATTGLTLENAGPGAFIRRLSEHAADQSWLLVWLLLIDGKPSAMEYQLQFNGVVSGLRADFDPDYSDYSPGTLLNWRIIEHLFERDAAYYALGPGSNEYKMRWVEHARELTDIEFFSRSLRGRLLGALETRCKPLARRLMRSSGGTR